MLQQQTHVGKSSEAVRTGACGDGCGHACKDPRDEETATKEAVEHDIC